ncbi:endonuclease/exonuclease/phosphatase family protein [Ancylostoma duodenale]|uniref:Endonuclease/exonuclease/phosphatase family protein n=1 Tax=Ancylostoma duodenale TaxID=51022 RepID=A0A0C2DZK7_9BILA|nr:endonuclease/exonuclease/phosphatase family protein [Ancylostoma duodenale]
MVRTLFGFFLLFSTLFYLFVFQPARTLDLLANHLEQIPDSLIEDVIVIALQEIPPSTKAFHEDALAIIVKPVRQTHSTVFSYRAWSQMVLVFMKKAHTRFATEPMAKFVPATTLAKPVRTKGAIGVCLRIYQRWTVIIACHLSHATVLQRIEDYHKIMRSLKFSTLCSFKGSDDILHADVFPYVGFVSQVINSHFQCVLWLGDLNFRITEDSKVNWKAQLQQPNLHDIENIMKNDELKIIRKKELAFAEFTEAPIIFAPTHKFELGTNDYVPNRIPSYTDRILYWARQPKWIETTNYNCIQKNSQSDHRAVYATLR